MSEQAKSLKHSIEKYLSHLEANGKSKSTIYTYTRDGKLIMEFFGEEREIGSIRAVDVGRFLKCDQLLKKDKENNRAEPSIQKTIRFFRMMLEWAHQKGYITEFQFPKSAMPKKLLKEKDAPNEAQPSDQSI